MVAWIVILLALGLVIGPVLYLMPTRKDRRLAVIRLEARRCGLVVELRSVRNLDAPAEERVSPGGEPRAPVHASVSYAMPLRARLEHLGPWRLLRSERTGWQFDSEREAPRGPDLLAKLRPHLPALPVDAVALELEGGRLACYWLERFPADGDTVRALKAALAAIGEELIALDEDLTRRLTETDT